MASASFDDAHKGDSVGVWWRAVVGELHDGLVADHGFNPEDAWDRIATRVAVADLYAYHSTSGWPEKFRELHTSQYTFSRVRGAFESGAILVNIWKHSKWVNIWNRKIGLRGKGHARFLLAQKPDTDRAPAPVPRALARELV